MSAATNPPDRVQSPFVLHQPGLELGERHEDREEYRQAAEFGCSLAVQDPIDA